MLRISLNLILSELGKSYEDVKIFSEDSRKIAPSG